MTNGENVSRNVRAASWASFFTDVSSEMVLNLVPLFLANVLGARTAVIGLVEGVANATASLVGIHSGWLADRLRARKPLAVGGYALSAVTKPFFYVATSWGAVGAVRWADRVGKGVRTGPRDALIAGDVPKARHGRAFGLHRAADTAGAVVGLGIAIAAVMLWQGRAPELQLATFRAIALLSVVPALLGVLILALGTREVPVTGGRERPRLRVRGLGRPFGLFLAVTALFDLGNSADAFVLLRAQERGLGVTGILGMLVCFNVVYAGLSIPAGRLSDRIGRKPVIAAGWILYAVVYLGLGLAESGGQVWLLYSLYGAYYGLTYGTAKAFVAGLVPESLHGTAFGTYAAVLGLVDLPASLIAGVLWEGVGSWAGFGPSAPFLFGAVTAALASVLLWVLVREPVQE